MKYSLLHKNSVHNVEETAKGKCQEEEPKCPMGLNQGSTFRSVTWEKAQKISNPFKQLVISEFQKEVKRKNLSCENEFYLHENDFHINSFAHNFALKQSLEAIRNGLIRVWLSIVPIYQSQAWKKTLQTFALYITTDLFWTMDAASEFLQDDYLLTKAYTMNVQWFLNVQRVWATRVSSLLSRSHTR